MSKDITQLSIKELLSGGAKYVIPMYQRNYAWEEAEIGTLIQDVIDYLPQNGDYYIGTLVVYEREGGNGTVFETIDGQQRLTTLSLLASYLKNSKKVDLSWYSALNIEFDSREQSSATFAATFEGKFIDSPAEIMDVKRINAGILNGYLLIQTLLLKKLKESGVALKEFTDFLFNRVQIMRVRVPSDTDLNHYFEIMNNRGEQLEKHEVLKAKLLEKLNDIDDPEERAQSQNCLHLVWEACANMERYVQMGFTPEQRSAIFGKKNWGQFEVSDFESLRSTLQKPRKTAEKATIARTLDEIITSNLGNKEKDVIVEESPERFNTVINFPNFLLHVLRVQLQTDVPLDDKRLISIFESEVLKRSDAISVVKAFTFSLLRCKYLFDQYVVKREFIQNKDGWSLKRLKWNDGGDTSPAGRPSYVNTFGEEDGSEGTNRSILMLLSAFHVSTPTMVYKHWLNAALHYLFYAETEPIDANSYLQQMESVAKAFVFDRFLAGEGGADYFEMIYQNKGICQARRDSFSAEALKARLSFGAIENNLVFNFLDYLLWQDRTSDRAVKSYEFTFRSSVEHYYPQRPLPGQATLLPEALNSFGNLCLISHDKNSRLSNFLPASKKEFYQKTELDSVKQYLMMQAETWDEQAIGEHYEKMKEVLLQSL